MLGLLGPALRARLLSPEMVSAFRSGINGAWVTFSAIFFPALLGFANDLSDWLSPSVPNASFPSAAPLTHALSSAGFAAVAFLINFGLRAFQALGIAPGTQPTYRQGRLGRALIGAPNPPGDAPALAASTVSAVLPYERYWADDDDANWSAAAYSDPWDDFDAPPDTRHW